MMYQPAGFLSTLSLRRATRIPQDQLSVDGNFYPRSPCGERRASQSYSLAIIHFYPRSPCGERQLFTDDGWPNFSISIHALLAESDAAMVSRSSMSCQFLSTLSLRRATHGHGLQKEVLAISIHALLAESDDSTASRTWAAPYFYPRSPCGERPMIVHGALRLISFLSTLSLRRATLLLLSIV